MTPDDWKRIYHGLALGKSSARELEGVFLVTGIHQFLGPKLSSRLEQLAPTRMKLASGKSGRITYFDKSPPELSGRIGDFVGMRGTFSVCEGRVKGVFDILAPNMRTVQKTTDLSGFWQKIYPALKAQLQRRYPKHPWP
jgi:ATP-dependent helicase HrpB